jgi:hypothetical protein
MGKSSLYRLLRETLLKEPKGECDEEGENNRRAHEHSLLIRDLFLCLYRNNTPESPLSALSGGGGLKFEP